ncbi:hypothetical protein LB524_10865 [Mesorhizobium sp. ESP6-5]|uniref:hypothetical protein n=1 Tax=Mesorhizobium sp. ESP6-5 TaxID=2876623 RepID=UPI001CCD1141|nr:hypothetical protein [Mesorhizobium sp. ESP6-5]MBZ9755787.1 hypothetical protein [Mesorhizobium sp. ESP6-5]
MVEGTLLAVGDSHLEALKLAAELNLLDVATSDFCIVPGATAVGLRNPNSLTDAVNLFKSFLRSASKRSHVLLHLGEVDCGFVMWWRANKRGESVEEQFQESVNAYGEFVSDILAMGFERLCITGASLPTLDDRFNMGEVANLRREVSASLHDRTQLTLRYNRALQEIANRMSVSYFDISRAVLDRSSHVVHEFFRKSDPRDHHLDCLKTVGIWAEKCNAYMVGDL